MCFTGGYALAMLADASDRRPRPRPAVGAVRGDARGAARDLGLSPADLDAVKDKRQRGLPGARSALQATTSRSAAASTRCTPELGDSFIAVEFPGIKHSTLTQHRQQEGVNRVLAFFNEKLRSG